MIRALSGLPYEASFRSLILKKCKGSPILLGCLMFLERSEKHSLTVVLLTREPVSVAQA